MALLTETTNKRTDFLKLTDLHYYYTITSPVSLITRELIPLTSSFIGNAR